MKAKCYIIIIFLLASFCSYSQLDEGKKLQFNPYFGLSLPSGDMKDFSNGGLVIGFSIDKYLNSKFALGLDFNLQSNSFSSGFDFSGISNPYAISETQNGNWSTSTFTFGPTYKIGTKKFTTEIYSKAGISYTKSPDYDVVLSSASISKSILNLPEQKRTSFGLTMGARFNFQLSERLKLFFNPQYVYSASKVEYCDCGLDNLENPDLILEQEPIKESFSPSFINLNAGLTFNLGGKKRIDERASNSVNRNLPGCFSSLHSAVQCASGGPQVVITSDWWGQNSNNTLSVTVYDGSTLVYSGTSISNNNQPLGASTGTKNHYFNAFGYEGRSLTVIITIEDQFGVVTCVNDDLIVDIPDCIYETRCGWDVQIKCDDNKNVVNINVPIVYTNVPAGSTLSFTATEQNGTPITLIPAAGNPSLSISGSNNSSVYNFNVNAASGTFIVFTMEIVAADGTVLCTQTNSSLQIPSCHFPACDVVVNSATCIDGNVNIDFNVNWDNFSNPSQFSIDTKLYDEQGNLINVNLPNYPLTGQNGTAPYNLFLPSQYAGTTITVKMVISINGVKDPCLKEIQIAIPECCIVCSNVQIKDVTNLSQTGNAFFINGTIIAPQITRVVVQLESFDANLNGTVVNPTPNFEFLPSSQINNSTVNIVAGLTNNNLRSTMITQAISPISSSVNYGLVIDGFANKILNQYSINFIIFKADGTYCEKRILKRR